MSHEFKISLDPNEKPMTKEELSAKFIENLAKSYKFSVHTAVNIQWELSDTEQLHLAASSYATNRSDAYAKAVKAGIAKKRTPEQIQGIWLAHYEGYREGYWVATGNEFTTDPAKLKEKDNG
jgi:hypothetical protein